jgi:hypothetical protein
MAITVGDPHLDVTARTSRTSPNPPPELPRRRLAAPPFFLSAVTVMVGKEPGLRERKAGGFCEVSDSGKQFRWGTV